ncbi:thioredoxin, mitochondrial isoform X1 [Coccinella septempunctata]|uniref:thioredoxin, mitochondrial isoform X1 n=1 Tax=Coccinella septempunctata TaxID=41139 RepID=UPI001D08723B|nr:thioredoxin, mitochondrial isoform X1 [Coccinella septempunctata]
MSTITGIIYNGIRKTIWEVAFSRNITSSAQMKKLISLKTDDEFLSRVMNSSKPVIVNFHADWCEPCHILTPKLEELIAHNNDIDLATLEIDDHPGLAQTFEVKAVPAVIAVRNGLVVDKFIGLADANLIEELIEKLINKE